MVVGGVRTLPARLRVSVLAVSAAAAAAAVTMTQNEEKKGADGDAHPRLERSRPVRGRDGKYTCPPHWTSWEVCVCA
jgi:hypothetical protein